MPIDRNARARLAARIRQDRQLSPTTRHVANAALFAAMDGRTGRCSAYRARLAHEAGCSKRSVTRATNQLAELGYLSVVPTYGRRHRAKGGRWFRPRGPNVLVWRISADFFLSDKLAADPSPILKPRDTAPLPEGLARVLERLGNAIADRLDKCQTLA
ncbi:MAG: helix-turn-helix domain-containing protein [Rhodospirillaceae bacterium]